MIADHEIKVFVVCGSKDHVTLTIGSKNNEDQYHEIKNFQGSRP